MKLSRLDVKLPCAILACAVVWGVGGPAQAHARPSLGSAFSLRGHRLLKGFRAAPPKDLLSTTRGAGSGAVGAWEFRYMHGPSSITYVVKLFPSQEALVAHENVSYSAVAVRKPGAPGSTAPKRIAFRPPMTPHQVADSKRRLRLDMERRGLRPDAHTLHILTKSRVETWAASVRINRVSINVIGHQHDTMVRRGKAAARDMLSDSKMRTLVERVAEEMVRRARSLPANQD